MKIVFAGTPQFAVAPLAALEKTGDVVAVITQEDKPQGRKKILTPSPVKAFALAHGLPVFQPKRLRDDIPTLRSFGADIMVTCAYGQILTQEALDCFSGGVWNIHAGLLPAYRGASPIQSCILNGEKETGVCVMRTALALDAGDVLLCEKVAIGEEETAGELSERLSVLSADVIRKAVPLISRGDYVLRRQGETGVNIYGKITREQAKIDFSVPAEEIVRKIRAMNPDPLAFACLRGGIVNIYRAQEVAEDLLSDEGKSAQYGEILSDKPKTGLLVRCGKGALKILSLQPSGAKTMTGTDFLNGGKGKKGERFE